MYFCSFYLSALKGCCLKCKQNFPDPSNNFLHCFTNFAIHVAKISCKLRRFNSRQSCWEVPIFTRRKHRKCCFQENSQGNKTSLRGISLFDMVTSLKGYSFYAFMFGKLGIPISYSFIVFEYSIVSYVVWQFWEYSHVNDMRDARGIVLELSPPCTGASCAALFPLEKVSVL